MHKTRRPEGPDLSPGRRVRSYSMSTEGSSLPGSMAVCPPASINPEPAYIAISAASQLVSAALELDSVTIAASALAQLNGFLDHVLFKILLTAKSTKLSLLRPAVHNVLKARLGGAALAGADEELQEFLGDDEADEEGGEDEDEVRGAERVLEAEQRRTPKREFDLELAWKLARLRCMVYCRLGDLEEDDEDEYIERENLDERGGRPRRYSSHPSQIPAASAIFLTSVLEFVAEQALAYATEATHRRLSKSQATRATPEPVAPSFLPPERVVVSDADMRHLGRDSPLQKLWRGWRHQLRPQTDPASRPISPDSLMVVGHSRKASLSAAGEVPMSEAPKQPSMGQVLQETDPAWIPLPMTENDADEIEMPELSSRADGRSADLCKRTLDSEDPGRPQSLETSPRNKSIVPATLDRTKAPPRIDSVRPGFLHQRSHSLPDTRAFNFMELPAMLGARQWITPGSTRESNFTPGAERDMEGRSRETEAFSDAVPHPVRTKDGPGEYHAVTDTMPETHPCGQMTNEGGMPEDDGRDEHQRPSQPQGRKAMAVKSAHEAGEHSAGLDKTPESQIAKVHELPTGEPTILSRTHPLRSWSKAQAAQTEDHPQASSPLTRASEPPRVAPGGSRPPPLAPLPETTRDGHERQAERSPVSPIRDAEKRQGQVVLPPEFRNVRPDSKSSEHTKSSSSSSKLLGFDREQQSAMQKSAGQGLLARRDPAIALPDRGDPAASSGVSDSVKEKNTGDRHTYTPSPRLPLGDPFARANPGNERAAATGQPQYRAVRNVENSAQNKGISNSTLVPRSGRSKEELASTPRRTATQDLAEFLRDTTPPGYEPKVQSAVGSINGLRSNPPETTALPPIPSQPAGTSRSPKIGLNTERSPAAKAVRSQYRPRDATVENPNTRDLADFAKSTGPEDSAQLPKILAAAAPRPQRTKSTLTRSQARDPVIRGNNSDLIDFIRRGPPRGIGDEPRLPRTVAPFRTTLDSDEFNIPSGPSSDLVGRKYSGSSNQEGSTVTKSTVNSRTDLIDPKGRMGFNPSNGSYVGASRVPTRPGDGSTPTTGPRRKIRDPYAIDTDSEDEMEDRTGRPTRAGEESLIDFLRNTSPPPESQHQREPLNLSTNPIPAQIPNVLRKPISGGFRDRMKRTASTHSLHRNGGGAAGPSLPVSDRTLTSVRPRNPTQPISSYQAPSRSRIEGYNPTQTAAGFQGERNREPRALPSFDEDRDEGSLSKFFSRKRRAAT